MSSVTAEAREGCEKTQVFVAAANSSSLNSIISMLEQYPDFEIAASALDGEECLQKLATVRTDILLTEIDLPKVSGVKIAEHLSLERPEIATIILADQNSLGFFRTAMLAGAMDFLTMPVPSEELALSVRRVCQLEAERRQRTTTDDPRHRSRSRFILEKSGKSVLICGGKGGTGKSLVAAHLAFYLQSKSNLSVALVDFDLQFGDMAILFDVLPKKSLLDLLPVIDELDSNLLKSAALRMKGGPDIFVSPPQTERSELITGRYVIKLMDALKNSYDLVVINTGPRIGEIHLDLFELSDLIVSVINQDISSLKANVQLKSIYNQLGLSSDRFVIVVNKFEPDNHINLKKIEDCLGEAALGTIPKLSKEAVASLDAKAIGSDDREWEFDEAVAAVSDAICRKIGVEAWFEPSVPTERRRGLKWPLFSKDSSRRSADRAQVCRP